MEQAKKIAVRTYDRELPAQFARIALAEVGIDSELKTSASQGNRLAARAEQPYSLLVPWDEAIIADEILSSSEACDSLFSGAACAKKKSRRWKKLSGFFPDEN
jgi:hypothetical protein